MKPMPCEPLGSAHRGSDRTAACGRAPRAVRSALRGLVHGMASMALLAGAGVASAADDALTVTNLASLHYSGPDIASEEGPPKGWPRAGHPLSAPLRVSGANGEFLYVLTRLGTGLVRTNVVPSQYTHVDGIISQLQDQAKALYAADHARAAFASARPYGMLVERTLADGTREMVGVMYVTANNKSSWSVGEPQPYPVISAGLLFRTDFDGANPAVIAATKGADLIGPQYSGVLVSAPDGTIYGIDQGGQGEARHGRIFRLGLDNQISTVHAFETPPDGVGSIPNGMVLGQDGALYGVLGYDRGEPGEPGTLTAPETPTGLVYRVDPAMPGSYRVLQRMTLRDGEFAGQRSSTNAVQEAPAYVIDGGDGWAYGTMSIGYCEAAPALVSSLDAPVMYAQLCGKNIRVSRHPSQAGLGEPPAPRYDVDYGNLHGMLYRVRTDGSGGMQVLHRFSGPDGTTPRGQLALGVDGAIYGTTLAGGPNQSYDDQARRDDPLIQAELRNGRQNTFLVTDGVLWRLDPARISADGQLGAGGFSVVHAFAKAQTGKTPFGVRAGHDGVLYGATANGGGPWTSSLGEAYLDDNYGTIWMYGVRPRSSVTLTIAPAEIGPGGSTELTWTTDGASQCVAASLRGDWTGSQPSSGSLTLTDKATGTYNYTLTCIDETTGAQVSSSTVQLFVGASPTATDGNRESFGNGGALGSVVFILLASLVLAGRRPRALSTARRGASISGKELHS